MEKWKPVFGYEGLYEVSSHGRVRSLDRISAAGQRRRGRIMRLNPDGSGYLGCLFYGGERRRFRRVHRLMAEAFLGPPPTADHQAAHCDGNRLHNHIDNIRWKTCLDNIRDKGIHGTQDRGVKIVNSVLDEAKVSRIRLLREQGRTLTDIAAHTGTCFSNVANIIHRRTWRHVA